MPNKLKDIEWEVINVLAPIILSHVEGCMVDIGIGSSTKILRKHSKNFGIKHYSCDIRPRKCAWAKKVGCEVYEKGSFDLMERFEKQPVAIVFLDGMHKYDIVKQEVEFFLPLLSYGGVIFIHDTNPPIQFKVEHSVMSSYKLRQELERDESVQVFTWPYTAAGYGLTMIMQSVKTEK